MTQKMFEEIKNKFEKEIEEDIKEYDRLIVCLGKELDLMNDNNEKEQLVKVNDLLDKIQDISNRNRNTDIITEEDMREVAEMLDEW